MSMKVNKALEVLVNGFILTLLILATVSHNGKLFGYTWESFWGKAQPVHLVSEPSLQHLRSAGYPNTTTTKIKDGMWELRDKANKKIGLVISSLPFSQGIYGFGGQVPLFIYADSLNTITKLQLLDNNETPAFVESVLKKGILDQWLGKSKEDIVDFKPDALSGATLTSHAINRTVEKSMTVLSGVTARKRAWYRQWNIKMVVAMLVVMCGAFMSFYAPKRKKLRMLQLVLNVVVLGFWCGSFISLKTLQACVSNGTNLISGGFIMLTLLLAVCMPLFFNKQKFYCLWVCPLGSAQELLGKLNKTKLSIPQKLMRYLKYSQSAILFSMFFLMWVGVATSIAEYEPFSVFIFQHASWGVIAIAVLSLITSVFINRPWCRFACPTGQILSWVHKLN